MTPSSIVYKLHGPFARSRNAILQTYIMVICCPMFLVNLFHYFGQRRRFFTSGAFTLPTSSFRVLLETRSILFLTKYDKIIA